MLDSPRTPDRLIAASSPRPGATRIAVTSGKGGVGKTSVAINLAVAMARLGHRVGLLDADFGLGNVDVMLGLAPERHLGDVLGGRATVADIALDGPSGVRIIPAGSGVPALTALDRAEWQRMAAAIDEASADLDFLFLDTATGIGGAVLDVISLADYVLLVTSYDPAAVVDAYAVIKLIAAQPGERPIGVLVNGVRAAEEAAAVFEHISLAAEGYLGRIVRDEGYIVDDESMRESVIAQVPVLRLDASSRAAGCIRRLASRLAAARPGATPWPAHSLHSLPLSSSEVHRCA